MNAENPKDAFPYTRCIHRIHDTLVGVVCGGYVYRERSEATTVVSGLPMAMSDDGNRK